MSDKIYKRERTKWLIPLRRFENKLKKEMRGIFDDETNYFIGNYNEVMDNGFSILWRLGLERNVKGALETSTAKVISFSAKLTDDSVNALVKKNNDFKYQEYIDEYLASQLFQESVTQIVDTYYEDIQGIIGKGIASELTRAAIAKEIADKLPRITKYRSETIAITETHRASSYASEKRAKDMQDELGVAMLKDWIPVSDGRTRQAHSAMRSVKPIPMNEMFNVGGEKMSRPNDPRGSAANTIRCRCIMRYIIND